MSRRQRPCPSPALGCRGLSPPHAWKTPAVGHRGAAGTGRAGAPAPPTPPPPPPASPGKLLQVGAMAAAPPDASSLFSIPRWARPSGVAGTGHRARRSGSPGTRPVAPEGCGAGAGPAVGGVTGNGGNFPGRRGAAPGGIARCGGTGPGPPGAPGGSGAPSPSLPPRRPPVPAASAALAPEPNMAAVVKVFDSHGGVGEGKRGGPEPPGPVQRPQPPVNRLRAGDEPVSAGRNGPGRAPCSPRRGHAWGGRFPGTGGAKLAPRLPGTASRGQRAAGTGGAEARPSRALRGASGALGGQRGTGCGAARTGPSWNGARTGASSRSGGKARPVSFVPSAELRGRARCWGFTLWAGRGTAVGSGTGTGGARQVRTGSEGRIAEPRFGGNGGGSAPRVVRGVRGMAGSSTGAVPGDEPVIWHGAGTTAQSSAAPRSTGDGRRRHDPARPRGAAPPPFSTTESGGAGARSPVPGGGGRRLRSLPAMLRPPLAAWGAPAKGCPALRIPEHREREPGPTAAQPDPLLPVPAGSGPGPALPTVRRCARGRARPARCFRFPPFHRSEEEHREGRGPRRARARPGEWGREETGDNQGDTRDSCVPVACCAGIWGSRLRPPVRSRVGDGERPVSPPGPAGAAPGSPGERSGTLERRGPAPGGRTGGTWSRTSTPGSAPPPLRAAAALSPGPGGFLRVRGAQAGRARRDPR
ncbi:collagen alpha-1(I) chain-like [Poecile atricapillus]|uniref:collagen alpha-1(I) chain-like n=1 Tax=Poecile atricapillus TaxID=48891 RepID=UPI00273A4470|nr:collagen alpha-1(I) chain-like [Poecile atricapillus]